jgi:4-diphosphocytidyl-2-C-methyl-D-erythritol kinase
MELFPNAKINIGLNILRKRLDGFHDIETLFFPIGLCDKLSITPSETLYFSVSGIPIEGNNANNLVMRAYHLINERHGIGNVKIHLDKHIPTGAGLGGGSADAAFTLAGLNTLFQLGLCKDTLKGYAAQLGSDCAFFIDNTPSLAYGRGEILEPFPLQLGGKFLVLVKPPVEVSTREAYEGVCPKQPAFELKDLLLSDMAQWQNTVFNQFENHIFKSHPQLGKIKQQLLSMGAVYAAMSGSGSSLYAFFDAPIHEAEKLFAGNFVYTQQY